MSRAQDHPIVTTLGVAASLFSIATGLAWCNQISPDYTILVGEILFFAVLISLVLGWKSRKALTSRPLLDAENSAPPTIPTVQGLAYSVDPHIALPDYPHPAQRYFIEAIRALADGGYRETVNGQTREWLLGIQAGKAALNWVNDHYLAYKYRYPGASSEQTKQ